MLISADIPRSILAQIDELVFRLRKANRIDSPKWPFEESEVRADDLTPFGEQVLAQYKKAMEDYKERRATHRRTTVSRSLVVERILEHFLK